VRGPSDGGARVDLIGGARSPTTLLTHGAWDRSRGPAPPLQRLVRKADPAIPHWPMAWATAA